MLSVCSISMSTVERRLAGKLHSDTCDRRVHECEDEGKNKVTRRKVRAIGARYGRRVGEVIQESWDLIRPYR